VLPVLALQSSDQTQKEMKRYMKLSYPFVFSCHECEAETTVTRAEARDLYPNPDSLTAVDEVLEQEKGWTQETWRAYCPDCSSE